jgi:diguanylate cyclase (GGDEF)-like protein
MASRALLDTAAADAGSGAVDEVTYQRLLLAKGGAQARLGQTEDGARIIREVTEWAELHDERGLLALCHRRLSALFRRVGDPALMLEHAVTAVNLAGEEQDPAARADYLLGLADALGASGSFEDSIARYQEALALAEEHGDGFLRLMVLNNLAYTQYEAGLGPEAVATAEVLRTGAEELGQPLSKHDGDTIARAYTAVGRFADAAEVLEPLCANVDHGEDCDGLVLALLTLTEVRRLAGAFDTAQEALDRADRLIEAYALTGRSIEAMREQADLYAARGAYREAYETYRDFHLADVELRAVQRDARARTLNAIFEATEARRTSEYFRELSVRDPLTGLHNRRHLDAELSALLTAVARGRARLAIGLVDLDHFKRVNDTRSHAVGDDVLRQVAAIMQRAVDTVDGVLVGRMGGEEFLVILPGLDRDQGIRWLDRLRGDIASCAWDRITEGVAVTASIGVAAAPQDALDRSVLLAHADRNLYRAKRAGRDRVQG